MTFGTPAAEDGLFSLALRQKLTQSLRCLSLQ